MGRLVTTVYAAAADILAAAHGGAADERPDAARLLVGLGYDAAPREMTPASLQSHRVALLRAADRMQTLFLLPVGQAPGLVFMGGAANPAAMGRGFADLPVGSLAGSGVTLREAFEGCVGEGVEYLSQFEADGDLITRAERGEPTIDVFPDVAAPWSGARQPRDWVRARRLGDGAGVLLPADRCLRRRAVAGGEPPPFALSTGCGAGVSLDAAALHGLLELIERDAASLWWRGGLRGRPLSRDDTREADGFLAMLRGGLAERTSWVLDITSDVGVPCAAAISFGGDGRGFACGLAARTTMAAAARSALKEMCHVELAYDVIAAKRAARGDASLNAADKRHLRRATEIVRDACPLLHPQGRPARHAPPRERSEAETLLALVERLRAMGIETHVVDLSRRQFGIAAARVVAPGLQLEPCDLVGARLRHAIDKTGGGEIHNRDILLL